MSPKRMVSSVRSKNRGRRRRGAFTVEFAICSGVFFMILLAGVEFARFMYARHSVDQAAYEGARVGIIPGATANQARETAQRILNATGVRNATVTVTPPTFNANTATVTVSVQCSYRDSSWMGPLFLGAVRMDSSMTLDHENKAYLLTDRDPSIGNNDHEPTDL